MDCYDGNGICGFIAHYALLFASFGSSLIALLYFSKKKSLHMDEEAKFQIFDED